MMASEQIPLFYSPSLKNYFLRGDSEICGVCKKLVLEGGICVVFIDWFEEMNPKTLITCQDCHGKIKMNKNNRQWDRQSARDLR